MFKSSKGKVITILSISAAVLITAGSILYFNMKKDVVEPLTGIDLKTAEIYSQLYNTSVEKITELKHQTSTWDEVGQALAKEKYNLSQEKRDELYNKGYSMVDMDTADSLSLQTGVDPLLIIEARGKIGSVKKWSEVKKKLNIDEKIKQANDMMKEGNK